MASSDFNGEVALITGAGRGIGRSTCLQLARDGVRVVVTDLNVRAAHDTLSLMPNQENHLALEMDVTQQMSVESVFAAIKEKFKEPPRLLVNSAGIMLPKATVDVMDTIELDVNLKGTFLVTQAFIKELLKKNKGSEEGQGAIVNISSMAAKTGRPDIGIYTAAKGGVISLSKSWAAEVVRNGIRVNCVLPGLIDTPLHTHVEPEIFKKYANLTPLGRPGRPEEVAEVIVFLLSKRSSFMVGACVEVSGGRGM